MTSETSPRWTLENLHREGVCVSDDGDYFLVDKYHPAMQLVINNMDIMSCPACPVQMESADGVHYRIAPFLFTRCCEAIRDSGYLSQK